MGFRCGIVGLPNVGKSTLFNALTETQAAQAANYPFCTIEPNVGQVAVPDERLGEVVGAVIWMKPESSVTADDMCSFLSARLAAYKVPCKIWMSNDALPKLGSEKIDKVSLRTQYREEYAAKVVA